MWNFYFSTPSEIILHPVGPTLSHYVMYKIKCRDRDLVIHLIVLLRHSLLLRLLFFVICIPLHLHLVSCGFRSSIYLLIFPCHSMTSSLPLYNYSTIPMLHFPLFYSSPLIKTTSPTSIFISLCIILCLSFPHRLFTLNVGFFSFLEYLHLAVLLESL